MMVKTNRLSLSFEPKFCLCGNSIDCVKKIKYLGFALTSDLKDNDDMNRQLRSIYGSDYKLRRTFFCCSKAVKKLFISYFVSCRLGATGGHFGAVPPKSLLVPPQTRIVPSQARIVPQTKQQAWCH